MVSSPSRDRFRIGHLLAFLGGTFSCLVVLGFFAAFVVAVMALKVRMIDFWSSPGVDFTVFYTLLGAVLLGLGSWFYYLLLRDARQLASFVSNGEYWIAQVVIWMVFCGSLVCFGRGATDFSFVPGYPPAASILPQDISYTGNHYLVLNNNEVLIAGVWVNPFAVKSVRTVSLSYSVATRVSGTTADGQKVTATIKADFAVQPKDCTQAALSTANDKSTASAIHSAVATAFNQVIATSKMSELNGKMFDLRSRLGHAITPLLPRYYVWAGDGSIALEDVNPDFSQPTG